MQLIAKLLEECTQCNSSYLSSIMFLNITNSYAELNSKLSVLNLFVLEEIYKLWKHVFCFLGGVKLSLRNFTCRDHFFNQENCIILKDMKDKKFE